MPRLLYAPASPYSAKVRMAARLAGIELAAEIVDTNAPDGELARLNPLGKIPVLLEDDGTAVFDSRVIMRLIDERSGGLLFASHADRGLAALRLEALADGVCDCLLAHVYERRFRPAEKVHQPWLDRQWTKAERALDGLAAAPPRLDERADGGQVALRALLGYLALRFAGQWESGRQALLAWTDAFDRRFPDLAALVPR